MSDPPQEDQEKRARQAKALQASMAANATRTTTPRRTRLFSPQPPVDDTSENPHPSGMYCKIFGIGIRILVWPILFIVITSDDSHHSTFYYEAELAICSTILVLFFGLVVIVSHASRSKKYNKNEPAGGLYYSIIQNQ